jgi:hypothetical protein
MPAGSLLKQGSGRLMARTVGPGRAERPFRYPEGRHGRAELRYVEEIPVLTVEGGPEEIGEAAGMLALRPGRRMAEYPEDLLCAFCLRFLRRPILQAGRWLARRFPAEYHREMEAMYAAAGVGYDRAVLTNTFYDVKKVVFCSALLIMGERSATGEPLLGRNLDYPPLGYANEYSLVTVYRPRHARHAFATVGFPGMVGCLSGMNDAGLAVAVMEAYQTRFGSQWLNPTGMPFALCFRRLLEQCATIDDAYAVLSGTKRLGLNSLVVADRKSVAVFEITPHRVVRRRPRDGVCICTNHFVSKQLSPPVTLNMFQTLDHFAALERITSEPGDFGIEELHGALDAVRDDDITLQTMVFEPKSLGLHLAIGTVPAPAGELRTLDLRPFLHESRNLRPGSSPRPSG